MDYFKIDQFPHFREEKAKIYNKDGKGAEVFYDTREKLQYLGHRLGKELGVEITNNYKEMPHKMAGQGKPPVLKEYIITGFAPSIYADKDDVFVKLEFRNFDSDIQFVIEVDVNFYKNRSKFMDNRDKFVEDTTRKILVNGDFPDNWEDLIRIVKPVFQENLNYINRIYMSQQENIDMDKYIKVLELKKQLILQGPPGTGKTYNAKSIAELLITGNVSADKKLQKQILEKTGQFELIQFHPSYSYEDFVRAITVNIVNGQPEYITENKVLGKFALKAKEDADKKYVLIIDEINRANLPAVLGELIYALEYRGESVNSMYAIDGDLSIVIPENLYIIGTMNTADRSVGHIDYAIRRRFAFEKMLPNVDIIETDEGKRYFREIEMLFINDSLSPDYKNSKEDVQIGHSYFMGKETNLKMRMKYEVLPIIQEYLKDGIFKEEARVKIEAFENSIS